jgi:hypothetical protein
MRQREGGWINRKDEAISKKGILRKKGDFKNGIEEGYT